jgi:RNA polymerase sigma factor (sigma-70 family)
MKDSLQLLREGDKKAFEELFDTNYQALCRYAYSILKDGVEAEDMVQRVFCKIWDKRSELEIHTSIKSYLYRIVHNECLNYVQQQANRAVINTEFFNSAAKISDNVNEQLDATELQMVIETAISKLKATVTVNGVTKTINLRK